MSTVSISAATATEFVLARPSPLARFSNAAASPRPVMRRADRRYQFADVDPTWLLWQRSTSSSIAVLDPHLLQVMRNQPCNRLLLETLARKVPLTMATKPAKVQPDQCFVHVAEFSWSFRAISYHSVKAPRPGARLLLHGE